MSFNQCFRDAVSKMADANVKDQLDESDIPGAASPKPAEFCTCGYIETMAVLQRCKKRKDLITFDQIIDITSLAM